jgi:hypothetical protein
MIGLWDGAVHALENGGPDVPRQVGVSLRELFRAVLHRLSPDDEIQAWSKDPQDFDNGKPTRKARLRFIARGESASMQKYVETDAAAVSPFLQLFDKAVHSVPPTMTVDQMRALLVRMAGLLLIILPQE